jgi:NADP-dependent 3-hydroxy acid dehydrogenase YdfG
MNIAITGHTKGIGKTLYTKFIEEGHSVLGFSLSSGYDISDPSSRNKIIELSKHCDLFINVAYNFKNYDDSQLCMLDEIYKQWKKDSQKHIINISSTAADTHPLKINVPSMVFLEKYAETKYKQDKWFELKRDYLNSTNRVKLTNIKPSRVYVEKFKTKWKSEDVLSTLEIYQLIKYIIDNPQIEFFSITLKKHQQ